MLCWILFPVHRSGNFPIRLSPGENEREYMHLSVNMLKQQFKNCSTECSNVSRAGCKNAKALFATGFEVLVFVSFERAFWMQIRSRVLLCPENILKALSVEWRNLKCLLRFPQEFLLKADSKFTYNQISNNLLVLPLIQNKIMFLNAVKCQRKT